MSTNGPENQAYLRSLFENTSRNTDAFRQLTQDGSLSEWLLQAFSSDDFSPIQFSYKMDPMDCLPSYFESLSEEDQEKARSGIAGAITSWEPEGSDPSALKDLAYLALYSKTIAAITPIGEKIINGSVTDTRTTASLILIISGFINHDREAPKATLLTLYEQERLHPELTGNLFLGLSANLPDEYTTFLTRFLSYEDYYTQHRRPGFFDRTLRTFIIQTMDFHGKENGWEIIKSHFSELPTDIVDRLRAQYDGVQSDTNTRQ